MAYFGNDNYYWRRILIDAGGVPASGDTDRDLTRKLAETLWTGGYGLPAPGDSYLDLVRKLLAIVDSGDAPPTGDLFNSYLLQFGELYAPTVTFFFGDSDNDILRKIVNGFVADSGGDSLLTEAGDSLTTEAGETIVTES